MKLQSASSKWTVSSLIAISIPINLNSALIRSLCIRTQLIFCERLLSQRFTKNQLGFQPDFISAPTDGAQETGLNQQNSYDRNGGSKTAAPKLATVKLANSLLSSV